MEALRRTLLPELVGDPETLIVDSTLLSILHPRQLKQSAAGFEGAAWVKWGSFAVYGVKLHLICATNRVPLSYELTAANAADVTLVRELLTEASLEEAAVARRLLGDLAYRSGELGEELAGRSILLWRPKGPTDGHRYASRWKCASRPSRESLGWTARWQRRWWVWSRG